MADTRYGWEKVVTPDDLEAHMIEIGQVKANGALVDHLMRGVRAGARVYVPGAGTGQIFDFMKPRWISFELLFADLRLDFLERIARRMPSKTRFTLAIDDVEDSKVSWRADVALIVLVLEHVHWRRALQEILKTGARELVIVIQRNEEAGASVVAKRKLRPSIAAFAKIATSTLVPASELVSELAELGFRLVEETERSVPDAKTMVGLRFLHR